MQDRALSRDSPDSAFSYTKAHGPTGKENVRKADCKAATPFGQNLCGARVIFESPGIILPLPRVDCIMYNIWRGIYNVVNPAGESKVKVKKKRKRDWMVESSNKGAS